jgi:hypothetical protein
MTTERIRVIHLVLSLDLGGLETMLLNLARNADLDAFDMRVLCMPPGVLARSSGSWECRSRASTAPNCRRPAPCSGLSGG